LIPYMQQNMDAELVIWANLVLCLSIVVLGLVGYRRSRHSLPLMMALVFSLFGTSHLLILMRLFDDLDLLIVGIRVLAYALIIYLLYRYVQVLEVF